MKTNASPSRFGGASLLLVAVLLGAGPSFPGHRSCSAFAASALAEAESPADEVCPYCGMVNCTMGCKDVVIDAQMREIVVMPGTPDWLFYAGVAAVLVVSFVVSEMLGKRHVRPRPGWRYDLLKMRRLKGVMKKPYFQFLFQAPVTLLFLFTLYAGLFGHQVINITPTLTWTVWWSGLYFLILFAGKLWCLVCPWDMIASLIARLRLFGAGRAPLNLGLKWPRFMRNIVPAIGLFILLTWLELGYHVTTSAMATAYLGIAMVALTVVPALLFEKKAFCRYGCMIGRISGLYANFAPVEVRAADTSVCRRCTTRDCLKGNARGNPCPTSLCLATLEENTYCIMCGECVKSCPRDNVALNLRPFGHDLFHYAGPRRDEAFLAIVLLSLTGFHGLTMTPLWDNVSDPTASVLGWIGRVTGLGYLPSFTIGMVLVLAAPILLYLLFCVIARGLAQRLPGRRGGDPKAPGVPNVMEIFVQFAYSLLPIALFYHLAHNGMHLFMEGQGVLTLASDPMGRGWDLFGTAKHAFPPVLSVDTIWVLQVVLVLIGHIYGIVVSQRTAQRLFGEGRTATVVQIPLLVAMVVFSFLSLWLMHLDMYMRGTLM